MCGRFISTSTPEQLAERLDVDAVKTEQLPIHYNVAPTMDVYAVLERDGSRRLGTLRWGFVPYWTKQLKGTRQPINARLETVATSKMFAQSFAKRRCIIPADGFYEWQDRGDNTKKQPFHLAQPDDDILAFAGIWTAWRDPTDEHNDPLFSAAIVTTEARGDISRIHPRMPVMLPQTLWRHWLTADEDEAPHLKGAIDELEAPRLTATSITGRVNTVANDGPELLVPGAIAG